jgi:7-carboxy-7-deazaguanine synthase
MSLRTAEVFGPTVQGEGPNTGKPTFFLRLAGCNLRCPGWGVETTLPSGEVVVGCDTPYAVFPQLFKDAPYFEVEELMEKISGYPQRVCLTGGEPLLANTEQLNALLDACDEKEIEVDIFTNGTLPISNIKLSSDKRTRVSVVMDYKLNGSGEGGKFLVDNALELDITDAIKFVVKDRLDFNEAVEAYSKLRNLGCVAQFYAGIVYGAISNEQLICWIVEEKLPWVFQLQEHKYAGIEKSELTWVR